MPKNPDQVRLTQHELFFVAAGDYSGPSIETLRMAGIVASPQFLADLKDSYLDGVRDTGDEPTLEDILVACDDGELLARAWKHDITPKDKSLPLSAECLPGAVKNFLQHAGIMIIEPEFPYDDIRVVGA